LFARAAGTLRHGHPFDPRATKLFASRKSSGLIIFNFLIGIDWKSSFVAENHGFCDVAGHEAHPDTVDRRTPRLHGVEEQRQRLWLGRGGAFLPVSAPDLARRRCIVICSFVFFFDFTLERLKKNRGRSERGFLGFGEALAKEQVC
jgi:hypothetical protein